MSKTITGWGMFNKDGLYHKDEIGLGMINGVEFQTCCEILEGLKDGLEDIGGIELGKEGIIHFLVKDIHWDDGQMTFPETGQWDFPPSWWYDIEITKIEYFPVEE